MLPRNFLETLGSVIAILVLFVQFLKTILFKFFTSNFEPFAMYFVRTFLLMHARRKDYYCYRKGSKSWKNCIHQKPN